MFEDFLLWVVIVSFALLLVFGIAAGWFSHHNSNFAALTVFHDLQPKDKQEAVEVTIEQKAGKRQFDQTNGDNQFGGEFEIRTESLPRQEENKM